MEETKQDTLTYKFHELIIHQNKLSLTLCDFFEITDFIQVNSLIHRSGVL